MPYERIRIAVDTLCGPGMLDSRLFDVSTVLVPLRVQDFPEALQFRFKKLQGKLRPQQAVIRALGDDEQKRIAYDIMSLFEDLCRLESRKTGSGKRKKAKPVKG